VIEEFLECIDAQWLHTPLPEQTWLQRDERCTLLFPNAFRLRQPPRLEVLRQHPIIKSHLLICGETGGIQAHACGIMRVGH